MQLRVHANIPQHARRFSLTHWLCWPGIESSNITLLAALPELRRTDCCKRLRLRSNMRLFKARLGGVLLGNQMVFSRKLQHGLKWCSRPTTNLSRHGLGYCRSRSVEALKCCWCFRSRSVTVLFGVLQEPICYGIFCGAPGADLLRHCLWYLRSRFVTAFFVELQEPICYGIFCGTSGADLLRHCLGCFKSGSSAALSGVLQGPICYGIVCGSRSRSVTAFFVVLQEPICYGIVRGTAGADLLRHCFWYFRSRSVTALFVVREEPICHGIVCGTSGAERCRT